MEQSEEAVKMHRTSSQDSPEQAAHAQAIHKISEQVKHYNKTNTPYRIHHGGTNSTRPRSSHSETAYIDTTCLNHVLAISTTRRTTLVEPNVPMSALVAATLPLGLVPFVVPEFPAITVGGAYAGTAGESSSFKHGFFDETLNWVDVVLPSGEVVRAKRGRGGEHEHEHEHADLFHGAAGAMGTLGVAVLFELRLRETAPYVRVTYLPVRGAEEALELLRACVEKVEEFEYVDAVLFDEGCGAVVVGKTSEWVDRLPERRFTRAWDPWFYMHVEGVARRALDDGVAATADSDSVHDTKSSPSSSPSSFTASHVTAKPNPTTELIPLTDYLFRYNRPAFWMGLHAFPLFSTPFNALTRFLLNPLLHTAPLYAALHASGYSERFVIQDLILPFSGAAHFLVWVREHLGIYPLWLCPIRAETKAPLHQPVDGMTEMFCNVGVWGPGREGYGSSAADSSRWLWDNIALESKVTELGGKKWLYAQVFAGTEEEFWERQGCDREGYEALRARYGAEGTVGLWEKIRRREGGGEAGAGTSRVRGVLAALPLGEWGLGNLW